MKNFGNRIPSLEEMDMFYNPFSDPKPAVNNLNQLNVDLVLSEIPGTGEVKNGARESFLMPPYVYTAEDIDMFGAEEREREEKCKVIIDSFVKYSNAKALACMLGKEVKMEEYLEKKVPQLTMGAISDYISRHGWDKLCIDHVLDEGFIENWVEFMNIGTIVRHQVVSIDFLYKFRHDIRSENIPNVVDDQEWHMFVKFMIMKSKEGKVFELHVNREFFNDFRNRLHAQHFKDINFDLDHSREELVRCEGNFNDRIKIFSYMDIPYNKVICNSADNPWRDCEVTKIIPMRENETLWELGVDFKLDSLEFFTIFE